MKYSEMDNAVKLRREFESTKEKIHKLLNVKNHSLRIELGGYSSPIVLASEGTENHSAIKDVALSILYAHKRKLQQGQIGRAHV